MLPLNWILKTEYLIFFSFFRSFWPVEQNVFSRGLVPLKGFVSGSSINFCMPQTEWPPFVCVDYDLQFRCRFQCLMVYLQIIACYMVAVTTRLYVGYAVVGLLVEVNSIFLHLRQLMQICSLPRNRGLYRFNSLINLGECTGLESKGGSVLRLYTPVSLSVPKVEGIYATWGEVVVGGGGIFFWGCTSGGVYLSCIYSHARWELA